VLPDISECPIIWRGESMKKVVIVMVLAFMGALPVMANDGVLPSELFTGPAYEGTTLLSKAPIPWDYGLTASTEALYDTVEGGTILHIDQIPGGINQAWYLPGQYGAAAAPGLNRHYVYEDPTNPWDPQANANGYTIEMKLQVLDVVGAYGTPEDPYFGFGLYLGEGSQGNALYDLEIFKDCIKNAGAKLYIGDLTNAMHTLRILRYPGNWNDPLANVYFELYMDGTMFYTGKSIAVAAGYNQDWFYLGGLAGPVRADVKIDYIRTDFTGAYIPEPATLTLLAGGLGLLLRRRK